MDLTSNIDGFAIAFRTVRVARCAICTKRVAGNMVGFDNRHDDSIGPRDCKTWLLCVACATAVVSEVQRQPLRTPLRLRVAMGVVAAERRPSRRLTLWSADFWDSLPAERLNTLLIRSVLAAGCVPPLLFLLLVVLTATGVLHP